MRATARLFVALGLPERVRGRREVRPFEGAAPAGRRFGTSVLTLFASRLEPGGARHEPLARVALTAGG